MRILITALLLCFATTQWTYAQPSSLQSELANLIKDTNTTLQRWDQLETSDIKTKFVHRMNENSLLMQLAKDMDSHAVNTDHDAAFYAEIASLMDYQIGMLYVSYQVLDFAKSQNVSFTNVLRRHPVLKQDLYKALNQPIKMQQAKVLFDRWLYVSLVSRERTRPNPNNI